MTQKSRSGDRWYRRAAAGALVGVPAAAAALGIAELTGALVGSDGPVVVLGDAAVRLSPPALIEWSIDTLGAYQKPMLLGGILLGVGLASPAMGLAALRRPSVGYAVLLVFAALGAAAVFVRPAADPGALAAVAAGAAAGLAALYLLLRAIPPPPSAEPTPVACTDEGSGPSRAQPADTAEMSPARRGFLVTAAGVLGVAAASALAGRWSATETGAVEARRSLELPAPTDPLPTLPRGSDLAIPGLAPFRTPNGEFYRIDTALTVPQVPPQQWTLRVHGLVDRPFELSFEDVVNRDLTEADITLTCVSNEINGDLVGNTRWLGVPLAEILREAGVAADADQILSTSTDGWTCGTPTQAVMDGRDALLAIGMGGEPLPLRHGFPARLVVPGIYGFVGATKWVTDIKLTRFADEQAYWAQRDWAVRAPIKTMCRIDVPGPFAEVDAGETVVAGVAWAQRRGIEAVEVRLDGGPWQTAELAEVPGIDTWRQWVAELEMEPGSHTIQARATDREGDTQTDARTDPIPDGATGWPSVRITAV